MLAACNIEPYWDVEGWVWNPKELPDVKLYDWIIHLNECNPDDTDIERVLEENLDFSQWLFKECQKYTVNLQYASSSSVYGDTKDFSEYAPCNPQTPYAWSKYLFDRWVLQQEHSAYVQGFRYFDVYGKFMHLQGNNANVIYVWQEQAKIEGKITVWENAEHIKRDWTWVGDVCRLQIDFIKAVRGSGIWNVGSGLTHSMLDIAEEIAELAGVPLEIVSVPAGNNIRRRGKTCADLTKLKSTVGKRQWLNVFEYLEH